MLKPAFGTYLTSRILWQKQEYSINPPQSQCIDSMVLPSHIAFHVHPTFPISSLSFLKDRVYILPIRPLNMIKRPLGTQKLSYFTRIITSLPYLLHLHVCTFDQPSPCRRPAVTISPMFLDWFWYFHIVVSLTSPLIAYYSTLCA